MNELSSEFWIQMVIYGATFGTVFGAFKNRLKELEKKMDKHNNIVERLTICEQSTKSAHHRIDEHKDDDANLNRR
ncbi:MAG: hypothetical protein CVU84_13400 [Firmicutes bacterium HGW-Firmicutes-1]|jgi:hypothetical protein|nr:MAG: hypothetical protein CVU84_13400 [Firmicutes bacterium HGW-Firmicutes-1]